MAHKRTFEHGGWFRVHNAILEQYGPEIGPIGIAIYCVIARRANEDTQEAYPSYDDIARLAGIGRTTVQENLPLLIELGLVEVVEGPVRGYRGKLYRLLEAPERDQIPVRKIHRKKANVPSSGIPSPNIPLDNVNIPLDNSQYTVSQHLTTLKNNTQEQDLQAKEQNSLRQDELSLDSTSLQEGEVTPAMDNLLPDGGVHPDVESSSPEFNIRRTPVEWVKFTEECFGANGLPIEFTNSRAEQEEYAQKIADRCETDELTQAAIKLFCADKWIIENKPDLEYLHRRLDEWLAKAKKQAEAPQVSWDDLE